ncbi:hypothetical protein FGO68_gene9783 [Halteria grandinella]|uniref:Uncharacterized protein n=1 Tax=Halteria grandinella TaxID=5974 RepID=A0A8J8NAK1_HALGN|nr:hypothetical protein FGO68_gene9783 [Halteria grandinella]
MDAFLLVLPELAPVAFPRSKSEHSTFRSLKNSRTNPFRLRRVSGDQSSMARYSYSVIVFIAQNTKAQRAGPPKDCSD